MKPEPLHVVIGRLKRQTLAEQIDYLRALIAVERPRSVRRTELESLLRGKLAKQLRRENAA